MDDSHLAASDGQWICHSVIYFGMRKKNTPTSDKIRGSICWDASPPCVLWCYEKKKSHVLKKKSFGDRILHGFRMLLREYASLLLSLNNFRSHIVFFCGFYSSQPLSGCVYICQPSSFASAGHIHVCVARDVYENRSKLCGHLDNEGGRKRAEDRHTFCYGQKLSLTFYCFSLFRGCDLSSN